MAVQFILDYYKQHSDTIQQQRNWLDPNKQIQFEVLCGDMSYKRFLRVTLKDQTFILVVIPTEGTASIETFADGHQLAVCPADSFINTAIELAKYLPQVSSVHTIDRSSGLIVLQDHGTYLFEDYVNQYRQQPELIINFFENFFGWLKQFQVLPERISKDFFGLQRTFEKDALFIELDEYVKYGIEYAENRILTENERLDLYSNFQDLANKISQQPLTLIHRDFQSKNIMIENNQFWIIDYQDLCYGPYAYDYASIIYDPYLDLENTFQENLITLCWEMNFKQMVPFEKFRADLQLCAIQRLLKAAGRYGRFLFRSGKDSHMKYYQPAVRKAQKLCNFSLN